MPVRRRGSEGSGRRVPTPRWGSLNCGDIPPWTHCPCAGWADQGTPPRREMGVCPFAVHREWNGRTLSERTDPPSAPPFRDGKRMTENGKSRSKDQTTEAPACASAALEETPGGRQEREVDPVSDGWNVGKTSLPGDCLLDGGGASCSLGWTRPEPRDPMCERIHPNRRHCRFRGCG